MIVLNGPDSLGSCILKKTCKRPSFTVFHPLTYVSDFKWLWMICKPSNFRHSVQGPAKYLGTYSDLIIPIVSLI